MNDTHAKPDKAARPAQRDTARPSLVQRLGVSIGAIAMLATASIIASISIADMSSGEARAINLTGSLRMQVYAIGLAVAETGGSTERSAAVEQAIAGFTSRYTGEALARIISTRSDDSKLGAYREIGEHWERTIKPMSREAVTAGTITPVYVAAMRDMVSRIDHLVVLIEQSLESKLQLLRLIQGVSLVALLLVGSITVYQLREKVLLPLRDLLHCARTVRRGDFSVRTAPREADELGQLGEAFNYMVEDLSEIYASLETRVQQKTDELARSNRSLELLYGTSRALSENAATRETLLGVLGSVERITGAQAGAILLGTDTGRDVVSNAAGDSVDALATLAAGRGDGDGVACLDADGLGGRYTAVVAPLSDGTLKHGSLALALPADTAIADWQLRIVEAVARHIASALASAQRDEERHRLALLDERSVIARELHDSLAQALSFLNIQVTRLQKLLPQDTALDAAREVVSELKAGLNDAYRQLRELLTTFRLRIDGRGLGAALDDTVQEFSRRSGLHIDLANRLPGTSLSSGQEIHVLQVIREALSNIEHHAQARHVSICLERAAGGHIHVTVDDDGIGIGQAAPHRHRYGLVIMRDRALSLSGDVTVTPRAEGGTRVQLEFPVQVAVPAAAPGLLEKPA